MENVFEEMLADSTAADEAEERDDFDHSYDLSDEDLADPEEDNESSEVVDDVDEEPVQNPTNQAFAQMRTQNKGLQSQLNEVESLVQSLGMKDINDFIAKAKDAQIKKNAQQNGISLEMAKELEEMRDLKNSIIAERNQQEAENREREFASNVHAFVEENKLSDAAVDKLSQDLEKDGFGIDTLMDMPKNALNRILRSYVGTNYQKNLERKNNIRKELPINQSSKIDSKILNQEIDALARQLAGK